jgi:hypothetical protein
MIRLDFFSRIFTERLAVSFYLEIKYRDKDSFLENSYKEIRIYAFIDIIMFNAEKKFDKNHEKKFEKIKSHLFFK